MLSNNSLCLRAAAQYVLLFLVQFNNSDQFKIYGVTCSYSSRPFLCALEATCKGCDSIVNEKCQATIT